METCIQNALENEETKETFMFVYREKKNSFKKEYRENSGK